MYIKYNILFITFGTKNCPSSFIYSVNLPRYYGSITHYFRYSYCLPMHSRIKKVINNLHLT